jgi:transketolase
MSSHRELANAIRALAMDAVQRAVSGHPGAPMGMADIAEVLWRSVLKFNPGNPRWIDRDRFVLSNGHASMLLYSVLYLTGYPLGIEEIKNFRQLGSRTPGHPEHDLDIGIETTTGPLGQGLANAVGMAVTEKLLALEFNRPDLDVVDHHTYVFMGDGCLMEGVSHEACSFAGTFKLGKLIGFYDDNGISIDGKVSGWFTDDTPKRFEAYGWHVIPHVDGQDADAVAAAIQAARAETARPSLICCKTVIGWGAPNRQGTKAAHGEALGVEEVALARKTLNWPYEPFAIPAPLKQAWDHHAAGAAAEAAWNELFGRYRAAHPQLAAELERRMRGDLPQKWSEIATQARAAAQQESKPLATRQTSQSSGARAPRRFCGSHRFKQYPAEEYDCDNADGFFRALFSLRRARVRHDGDHERHGAAWRIHPLRRNVPRFLRLRPERRALGGTHASARDSRLHARFHRLGRGWTNTPAH